MDLEKLRKILRKSWCKQTAYEHKWTPSCPELNQCAVTALIVQDYFGGDLLVCDMTNGGLHFYNHLPDNTEIDLTEKQFRYLSFQPIKAKSQKADRNQLLANADTKARYKLLKKIVKHNENIK